MAIQNEWETPQWLFKDFKGYFMPYIPNANKWHDPNSTWNPNNN